MTYSYNGDLKGKLIMVFVTAISNFACLPVLCLVYKQKKPIELWYGFFTFVTSFMYHFLDSIDQKQFLIDVGTWHKLDNIGSISCFLLCIVYLMRIQNSVVELHLKQAALFMVIIFQEYHPWLLETSLYPIFVYFVFLLLRCLYLQEIVINNVRQKNQLYKSVIFLVFAISVFSRGLDEHSDTYRCFHGCWHLFIGLFSFYFHQSDTLNPTQFMHLKWFFTDFKKVFYHQIQNQSYFEQLSQAEQFI